MIKESSFFKMVLPFGVMVAPWRKIAAIKAPGIEPISRICLPTQGWSFFRSKANEVYIVFIGIIVKCFENVFIIINHINFFEALGKSAPWNNNESKTTQKTTEKIESL